MRALLAGLALLAGTSAAAPVLPDHSTPYSDGTPPTRFQGDNYAVILFVSDSGIDKICGKAPSGMKTLACTDMAKKIAVMTLPNPCAIQFDYYAHLVCHELGHVNGWPAMHGD